MLLGLIFISKTLINNTLQQPKWKRFCEERSFQSLCLHLCPAGNSLLLGICFSLSLPLQITTELIESVRCDCARVTFLPKRRNGFTQVLQCLCKCHNLRIRWISVPYQRIPSLCTLHTGNFLCLSDFSQICLTVWRVCSLPLGGSRGISESLLSVCPE